jgi:hypothetical protein
MILASLFSQTQINYTKVLLPFAINLDDFGPVNIYGEGWHRREKGWVNKILSE